MYPCFVSYSGVQNTEYRDYVLCPVTEQDDINEGHYQP